jgi:hypothetical protein
MSAAKFRVGENVRLIGTDTVQTITQFNAETLEYLIHPGNEEASRAWVLGIYLELADPSSAIGA